jgi:hypothetical protein
VNDSKAIQNISKEVIDYDEEMLSKTDYVQSLTFMALATVHFGDRASY